MAICALTTRNIDIVILQEMKATDDRYILGKDMQWVQQRFGILMSLFDQVGLIIFNKIKSVVCIPEYIWQKHKYEAYHRKISVKGPNYQKRKRVNIGPYHPTCSTFKGGTIKQSSQRQSRRGGVTTQFHLPRIQHTWSFWQIGLWEVHSVQCHFGIILVCDTGIYR